LTTLTESLLDTLDIVVVPSTGFAPLEQTAEEDFLGSLEEEHEGRFADLSSAVSSLASSLPRKVKDRLVYGTVILSGTCAPPQTSCFPYRVAGFSCTR
jgi:hypothetical protein